MWETPVIEIAEPVNAENNGNERVSSNMSFVKSNQVACDHISCC